MISREQSKQIKGLGIILIMMLHFWYAGNGSWLASGIQMESKVIPISFFGALGSAAAMCTSVFALLTGYSFYAQQDRWNKATYRIRKIRNIFLQYWIFYLLFLLIGTAVGEPVPDLKEVCFSLLALNTSVGAPYINVVFAWYVSFYAFVILLFPLIHRCTRYRFGIRAGIYVAMYLFCKGMNFFLKEEWMWQSFWNRAVLIVAVMTGYLIAEYQIFERIQGFIKKKIMVAVAVAMILVTAFLLLRIFAGTILVDFWGPIYAVGLTGIYSLCLRKQNFATRILSKLGEQSMGMWFISGIFFLPSGRFQNLAYFMKNPVLVLVWVLVVTWFAAYCIDRFQKQITGLIIRIKSKKV